MTSVLRLLIFFWCVCVITAVIARCLSYVGLRLTLIATVLLQTRRGGMLSCRRTAVGLLRRTVMCLSVLLLWLGIGGLMHGLCIMRLVWLISKSILIVLLLTLLRLIVLLRLSLLIWLTVSADISLQ